MWKVKNWLISTGTEDRLRMSIPQRNSKKSERHCKTTVHRRFSIWRSIQMRPFDYLAPISLGESVALLAELDLRARVMAGSTMSATTLLVRGDRRAIRERYGLKAPRRGSRPSRSSGRDSRRPKSSTSLGGQEPSTWNPAKGQPRHTTSAGFR
jgi:hypothetical protein